MTIGELVPQIIILYKFYLQIFNKLTIIFLPFSLRINI